MNIKSKFEKLLTKEQKEKLKIEMERILDDKIMLLLGYEKESSISENNYACMQDGPSQSFYEK